MSAFQLPRTGQSWLAVGSVGGLLVVLMIAGTVGIMINRHVTDIAHQAVQTDVQLEDRGDDLRAAVLDLRHYHRNIVFAGVSRGGLADFEAAYQELHRKIDALEELGIDDEAMPNPAELRALADRYYGDFRPAIDLHDSDHQAFLAASDDGLIVIDELDQAAQLIDRLGEQRAETALTNVERSSRTATLGMGIVLGGLLLFGVMLAYLAIRTANEVRRLYAEQRATSEQLERTLQSKNDFIADASHELRTPLTVLRGNAEVGLELERDCVHTPILEGIVRESERMTRLVEDLLFLTRSDSGSLPLEVERVRAASLGTHLIEAADMLTRRYGTTLDADLEGDGEVEVDAARIEQAVLILVDNAAKYGSDGQPVSLGTSARAGEFAISVADRGPGIPEADVPMIFERFYRVDKTRARKRGGAGLGLAIAKSIVEAHGGRIEVRSQLSEGTTMTLYLPLVAASLSKSALPLSRQAVHDPR